MKNPRALFTTAYRSDEPYDWVRFNTKCRIRLTQPRVMCPGLRFIKENLPQIQILEFPSQQEFGRVLRQGWDVVGFSFFTFETAEILRMADCARKAGVRELWAGNYGALNPLIACAFDKVMIGYAEAQIGEQFGASAGELAPPALIDNFGIVPLGAELIRTGWLSTARGCPMKCTFCQTPSFASRVVTLSLDSIERALRYYKKNSVRLILVFDEDFGIAREHSREVAVLLRKSGLPWVVGTRSDILEGRFDEWYESGMVGVNLGVESMDPDSLVDVRKALSIDQTIRTMEKVNRHDCVMIGSYMIGFERDTVSSVTRNLRELRRLRPDFMKVFVLTPFPKTLLWDHVERQYGIDCSDWSKFNAKHLVWNHPQLSEADAQALLSQAYRLFNSEDHVLRFVSKIHRRLMERGGPARTHSFFLSGLRDKLHGGIFMEHSVECETAYDA
ncbi:MAG: radical SAM protein [Acidobacteriia bacterium]|nr:radical SAM protein [Terriglobia bacterium]